MMWRVTCGSSLRGRGGLSQIVHRGKPRSRGAGIPTKGQHGSTSEKPQKSGDRAVARQSGSTGLSGVVCFEDLRRDRERQDGSCRRRRGWCPILIFLGGGAQPPRVNATRRNAHRPSGGRQGLQKAVPGGERDLKRNRTQAAPRCGTGQRFSPN